MKIKLITSNRPPLLLPLCLVALSIFTQAGFCQTPATIEQLLHKRRLFRENVVFSSLTFQRKFETKLIWNDAQLPGSFESGQLFLDLERISHFDKESLYEQYKILNFRKEEPEVGLRVNDYSDGQSILTHISDSSAAGTISISNARKFVPATRATGSLGMNVGGGLYQIEKIAKTQVTQTNVSFQGRNYQKFHWIQQMGDNQREITVWLDPQTQCEQFLKVKDTFDGEEYSASETLYFAISFFKQSETFLPRNAVMIDSLIRKTGEREVKNVDYIEITSVRQSESSFLKKYNVPLGTWVTNNVTKEIFREGVVESPIVKQFTAGKLPSEVQQAINNIKGIVAQNP